MSDSRDQVIKIGGALLEDRAHLDALVALAADTVADGRRVVIVHGGGKEIGELHERLGVPFRKHGGLRVTTDESMAITTMVLCGLVNKRLVAYFRSRGWSALGVSGADLGMRSPFLNRSQLGRVGGPPCVDASALHGLLDRCDVLVVSPVCLAPDDELINVNADVAAQATAVALRAQRLDFVTDVEAVRTGSGRNLDHLRVGDIDALMRESAITGGMIPKLQSAIAAIDGGVGRVRVGNLGSLVAGSATEVHA